MIASEDHPLVRAYLRRFDAVAARLPEGRRAELRAEVAAHLHEATSPDMPDGAVRDVLDDLGDPSAIVGEESAELPPVRHISWIVGGGLLILSVVIGYATQYVPDGGLPFRDLAWAGGVLVLALGTPSVTAHRPLGTGALVGLGIWVIGSAIVSGILVREVSGVGGDTDVLITANYIDLAGRFLLAIVAVVQVGRIEVIRRPWRWVPAWVLGIVAVEWLVEVLLWAVAAERGSPYFSLGLGGLVQTGGTLVLGAVVIALGAGVLRQRGGDPESPTNGPD